MHIRPRAICALTACLTGLTGTAGAQQKLAPPQIAVSPPRVEVQIGPRPSMETIRLFNFGDQPVEVQVGVEDWELDEANRVRAVEPTEQSLGQWMLIAPLRFTVDPGASQAVRFSVRPRIELDPGEHRAMVYFQQVPPADPAPGFRVSFKLGVAVYGYVGKVVRRAVLNDLRVRTTENGPVAAFDISSTGSANVRLDGQYGVWQATEFPGVESTAELSEVARRSGELPPGMVRWGALPGTPVLPGFRRTLLVPMPTKDLEPGRYVFDVNATLGGDLRIDRALEYEVLASTPTPTPVAPPTPTPTPTVEDEDTAPSSGEAGGETAAGR